MSLLQPETGVTRRTFLTRLALLSSGSVLPPLRAQEPRRNAEAAPARIDDAAAERQFRPSSAIFPNPERGFYAQRSSQRMERLDALRDQGITLLLVTLDLRNWKDRPLSLEKLDELRRALEVSRKDGFKVIFRAAYGFTKDDYRADPQDLGRIVGHVGQMGAVLTENGDVVCGIQAGMLGPWGEWHGSNHGNPPALEARRAVLFAWLDAVPPPITVHVRRPMFIRDIFGPESGGFELSPATAFSGSRLSRTGWHNDAFLVPPSDLGTYAERGWDRERELQWCHHHGRFTPFGGETVHSEKPLPVAAMIREMELLHATYLNIAYHPRVLQSWRESEHHGENTFQHIARRLGYRFVAERMTYRRSIHAGDAFSFVLTLHNEGFASPHLPHMVEAALFPAAATVPAIRVLLPEIDVRRWEPDSGSIPVHGVFRLPKDFTAGRYRFGLRFADASSRLSDDGRYAIRLANADIMFFAEGGWNILAEDIRSDAKRV
jgi:hypothetical protein